MAVCRLYPDPSGNLDRSGKGQLWEIPGSFGESGCIRKEKKMVISRFEVPDIKRASTKYNYRALGLEGPFLRSIPSQKARKLYREESEQAI